MEGTLGSILHRSQSDPLTLMLLERFTGQEAFSRHMASDYFRRFQVVQELLLGEPFKPSSWNASAISRPLSTLKAPADSEEGQQMDDQDARRRAEFMQALTTEHFALQSGRSATISESASRSALYLTTLSSAVVVLALVVQVSHLGQAFFVFAFAILPVVFFLGLVTFGRLLQTGVEDVIYARAISRIRTFYGQIDPSQAHYFAETSADHVGLTSIGLFRLRWQQFLASAATIAVVNAVVGGAFVALTVKGLTRLEALPITVVGAAVAALLAFGFLRYQWRAWMRTSAAINRWEQPQP